MTEHVSTAMSSIPNVMMWDDHDIFDGFGSYDKELQTCPVFKVIRLLWPYLLSLQPYLFVISS